MAAVHALGARRPLGLKAVQEASEMRLITMLVLMIGLSSATATADVVIAVEPPEPQLETEPSCKVEN